MNWTIRRASVLGNDEALLTAVRMMFRAGQAEGAFEPLRTEPTGMELAVWADRDGPVGFALVTAAGPQLAAMDLIYVRPEFRRQGIARSLLGAAVQAAAGLKASALLIGMTMDNEIMRNLSAELGFTEAGIIVRKEL